MKKIIALLLAMTMIFGLTACKDKETDGGGDATTPTNGSEDTTSPSGEEGTASTDYDTVEYDDDFVGGDVRVYATFNGEKFLSYNESSPWEAPHGKTYVRGDLLPTWEYINERLNINVVDVTPKSGANSNELLQQAAATRFEDADVFMGSPRALSDYGLQGYILPLNDYFDKMPNFKAFLDANPTVTSTLTQADGNIYMTPYFDDFNEIERMFLMRLDWVMALLDEDGSYDTGRTIDTQYTPFYDYAGGKNVSVGHNMTNLAISDNIIDIQNNLAVKNGANLVGALKDYIDENYMSGQTSYSNRSDLFISSEAAYDADELIALMRAVKTNPVYLTGQDKDLTVFSQRNVNDALRSRMLMAIWGVRGVDARNAFYFFDESETLVDARTDEAFLNGLEMLNLLYEEGLMLQDFDEARGQVTDFRATNFLENDGFITYDYAASTVAQHDRIPEEDLESFGTIFEPVVSAAAQWFSDDFIHFAESNRSVKTQDGWGIAINTSGVELESALRLLDYPFSADGLEVMTFGPQGVYWDERIEFAGNMIPKLFESFSEDAATYAGGNWSNFMRGFIGATFGVGHVKQTIAIEMQVSNVHYANGIQRIADSNTMLGQMSSTAPAATRVVPTIFPLDEDQVEALGNNTFGPYYDEWQNRIIKYGFGAQIPNSTNVVPTRDEFLAQLVERGIDLETRVMNQAFQSTK